MSRIEELSIRGIRSFGHKDQDTQVIQFFHPLTLITGQNGAGKTSVIECLRYISTGEPPSLTKSGAYFVHDPKVAHETEVEAQVKLKFTNVFRQTSTAEINSVVTSGQKDKKKDQYKTRGVAIYRNRESFTYTLAEFGRQMVTLLGVSKPVLNNVIFCHQEDSNWPLGEGKAVKTKFDEIFAATRYRKALENMRKIRKEQDSAIEKYEIDIKHLKVNKEKAKELHAEYEEKKEQLSDAEKSVIQLKEDLLPIEDRLREISAKENQMASWRKDQDILGETKKQMAKSIKEIKDGLEEVFKGSLKELNEMIKEHQNTMKQKKKAQDKENMELENTKKEVDSLRKTKSGLLVQQGKMELAETLHCDNVTKRNKKIHETAQKWNIPGYDDLMYDSSKVENFIKILDDKVNQQKEEITNCTQKYEKEISVLDKKYQELYRSYIKLNCTIQTATESMEQNKEDLKKIRDDLNKMDRTAQQLPKRKKSTGRTLNVDELKADIQQLQHEKEEKEATMSKLSEEVSALSVQSKASAKLEILHEEKESKEDKIQEILRRLEGEEVELTGNFSTERIAEKLSDIIDQKHSEVQDAQSKLEKANAKIWNLELDRRMLTEEVEKLQDGSNSSGDTWFDVCDEVDLEQSMETIQQSINTFHSEKGSTDLLEQYVASAKRQDAKCPLCHRRFDSPHGMNDLFQELEGKLHLARRKLLEKATEILDTVNYSFGKQKETVSSHEPVLNSMQEEVNLMKHELLLMDYCQNELSKLEGKIAVQSLYPQETDANRTMQQVISQWQDVHLSLRLVSQNLQEKQQLMEEQTERLRQKERLQEKETELISTEQNLKRLIERVQAELKPVKQSLNELATKRNAMQREKDQDVEKRESKMDKLVQRKLTIASLTSAIDSYLNDGNKDKLEKCQRDIKSINLQVGSLLKQQTKQEQTIKHLQKDLAKQELQKLELENNLALRKKRMELENVERQIMRLEEKCASVDTVSLMNEKSNLNKKYSNMVKNKSRAEGVQDTLREVVKKKKEELDHETYKQADFKYNDMLIKLVTTKEVSSDIEKYYKALEEAIMKYHTLKMFRINKIIKEYWRKTYRGNDIDYIKICSDPDENTTIQARRTYNYRVVMVTGGAELDMRGRCSAGQKVLASLIIRLALAETFCLDCGILALDEPTTNLDEENMKSLADALVEIIDTPEAQRNIQLIVITHNENFVEQLGRSGLTDNFFRIAKNDENKSVIRKVNIANLQAIAEQEAAP